MENLLAPWRLEYVKSADRTNEEGCIFCDLPADDPENDRKNLIVHRGAKCFVILNKFPYNGGHLMIVPYQHTNRFDDLSPEEKLELKDLLQKCMSVFEQTFAPHGYNIGMNLGRPAGAGITYHLHFHLVPRWTGDTNFMPVVGDTKIMSVGLDEVWGQLHGHFGEE